jgi:hypothetical protein
MEHSPSWGTECSPVGQGILHILWNVKVYCCLYKNPTLDPILRPINPVCIITLDSFKIHFTTTLLYTPNLQSGVFLSDFRTKIV